MDESRLLDVLHRLRRRGASIGALAGVLWGGVAAAATVALACWLDLALEFSPVARFAALGLAGFIGLAMLLATFQAAASQSRPLALARRLDDLGTTGGQIIAGVDLAALRIEGLVSMQPVLSAGLANMAVQRAAALAGNIPRSLAVPLRPVARAAAALGLAALLVSAVALLWPDLARTQWLRFSNPRGDHPPFSFVAFRVEPGAALVRYGDGLDIFVAAEGRLVDAVELVLQPPGAAASDTAGEVLPMFQEPSGRWRASLAEVKEERQYFARARRARSQKFPIAVLTVPQITDVRFRLTPPAYSRLPVYEGALPAGGIAGLTGTQVEVRVHSNRPLRSATARLVAAEKASPEQSWNPISDGAAEAAGSFALDHAGRLEIQVTDIAGQRSRETFSAPLALLPDERPFVRLIEPRAVSFATPLTHLPVVISAEDDFGVARLEIFRSLNDSRSLPQAISLPEPPPRRAYQSLRLPLDQYGLSPGDEIKLFARVEDNDPAGGKGSESAVATVRIISEEEFQQMIRARDGLNVLLSRYQQAQRRLEGLAQEIEQLEKKLAELPADSPLAEGTRGELEKLAERIQQEAEALQQLAKSPLPYDLDKELSKYLGKLGDRLGQLAKDARSLAGQADLLHGPAAKELEGFRKQLAGDRKELDQETGPPLEMLAAIYPLLEDEGRFTQLYEHQRDLAERLAALRGRDKQDDPTLKARMRDLEGEQRQLQGELVQLLDDIDSHSKRLPDRPELKALRQSAEVFAMLVRKSEAADAMSQAEAGLAEFAGTRAHSNARRAADILETFLAKCQGIGQEGEACLKNEFQPSLSQCLGETLAQLLADAGYGRGSGAGTGAGGGYSARRSSLANIGLYGGLPALGGPQGTQPRDPGQMGGGDGRYSAGTRSAAEGGPGPALEANRASASGGEASVPPQYRRKVGRYFQRLADEIGTQAR